VAGRQYWGWRKVTNVSNRGYRVQESRSRQSSTARGLKTLRRSKRAIVREGRGRIDQTDKMVQVRPAEPIAQSPKPKARRRVERKERGGEEDSALEPRVENILYLKYFGDPESSYPGGTTSANRRRRRYRSPGYSSDIVCSF
jgi:hypothetical protein